jgi:hypothetical protein
MPAPHPYRTPEPGATPPCPEGDGALRTTQAVTKLFLVGWSLVRVAVCAVRGLDLEGCAALVVVVAMVSSLVNTWSRFS